MSQAVGELVDDRGWGPGIGPVPQAVVLVGPTASGKSRLAVEIAGMVGSAEILCADSMSVYRGMDIGTMKPSAALREAVPHHLLDLVDPHEEFSVHHFQLSAGAALSDVAGRGVPGIVAGGTGLYVRAVVDGLTLPGRWPELASRLKEEAAKEGALRSMWERLGELDPDAAARILPNNERRILRALEVTIGSGRPFSSYGPGLGAYPDRPVLQVALDVPLEILDKRIEARIEDQMESGWLEEVARLLDAPMSMSHTAAQAIGYRELAWHLEGEIGLEEAVATTVRRTRSLARRQLSWFRRDPRLVWVASESEAVEMCRTALGVCPG